jgi:uncharacterized membrane protein YdjX (TVP38/TMEM64 family)
VLPIAPVEPYLIAAVATGQSQPIALGLTAAFGQTAGKLLLLLTARGAVRSAWLQRKLTRVRRADRHRRPLPDQPWPATGVLAISASTGIPPLLATTVYFGSTRMRPRVFAVICLAGPAIRFVAVAYAPALF